MAAIRSSPTGRVATQRPLNKDSKNNHKQMKKSSHRYPWSQSASCQSQKSPDATTTKTETTMYAETLQVLIPHLFIDGSQPDISTTHHFSNARYHTLLHGSCARSSYQDDENVLGHCITSKGEHRMQITKGGGFRTIAPPSRPKKENEKTTSIAARVC